MSTVVILPSYISTLDRIHCYSYSHIRLDYVYAYRCQVCDRYVNLNGQLQMYDNTHTFTHTCLKRDKKKFVISFQAIIENRKSYE
jgi:hypothetical protein